MTKSCRYNTTAAFIFYLFCKHEVIPGLIDDPVPIRL